MARRRQAVTIKHVAADAGVSLQTVSRVINNELSVRPALKEHVQASITRLGYVPSIAAQRMSGSKSYLILAINDRDRTIADWRARQGRDWVDQMLLGGMLKCAEHGYRMIFELIDTHSDHVERELSAAIAALQPDGIILTPPHSENPLIIGLLAKHNIAFARIGSLQSGPGIAMTMGDEDSAFMATQNLLDLGHMRVGFIAGPEELGLSQWRIAGWMGAMEKAGLDVDQLMVRGDFGYESGVEATNTLLALDQPPTAIVASNDQMALAALDTAIARGLRVPEDLSLISFDNSPVMRFTSPQITAIDQPIAETFSMAVELLIANGSGEEPSQPIVLKSSLVARGSTAPPRLRHERS
jgi:LacI family transcriptional regulator